MISFNCFIFLIQIIIAISSTGKQNTKSPQAQKRKPKKLPYDAAQDAEKRGEFIIILLFLN